MRSAALNALTTFPRGQSARVPARPAGKPRRRRLPTPRRKAARARCGRARPTRRGAATAFTQVEFAMLFMGLLAAAGHPLLREAGKVSPKATDGVWKAGMVRRRFAMTVVQSDLGRSSGPHPIRRHSPSKDGRLSTPYGATFPSKLGKGSARRSEMGEHCRERRRAIGERSAAGRPNASCPEMFPQTLEKIDSAPGNRDRDRDDVFDERKSF